MICIDYSIKETALSLKCAVVEKQFCDVGLCKLNVARARKKLTDIFTFLSFVTLFDRCVERKVLSMSFVLDNLRHL